MRKIIGLNYYYKLDCMIKECVEKASLNPFEHFIFIAEDKKMVEKRFFLYTNHLINIEIMTWNQYMRYLQVKYHKTHKKVIDLTTLTFHLYSLLKHNQYQCFNTDQPYPLIRELIKLVRELDLNQTMYTLPQPKLNDFMTIYNDLLHNLDDHTYLSLERIISECQFSKEDIHLYIEADSLLATLRQDIIGQLANVYDVTLMYTCLDDDRLLNLPFQPSDSIVVDKETHLTKYLFMQSVNKKSDDEIYTFVASSPLNEVKQTVYSILQNIADKNTRYCDYIIAYPNDAYASILQRVLEEKRVPHNLKIKTRNVYDYDYKYILTKIDNLNCQTTQEYANALLKEDLDDKYKNYLSSLTYNETMTNEEFKEFFKETCQLTYNEINTSKDTLKIVSIDNLKADCAKYIYILGMNETILPEIIKDTNLLLDEDIYELRKNGIPTPLTSIEKLGMSHNHILKALSCPHHTLTISYSASDLDGKPKLPSTLYKQLEDMFSFKPVQDNTYMAIDDFYLMGGLYDKHPINDVILNYKSTKGKPSPLDTKLVHALYNPKLSVSQIETYNKCPYLYFIQYGLGVYPLIDNTLKSNELGSLVHYVLSICLNNDKDIHHVIEYYLSKNPLLKEKIAANHVNQYFIDQLKDDLKITLTVLKNMNETMLFKNKSLEEKIEGQIHGLDFKGFVDRVDTYKDNIAILDYKSSAKDIDLNLSMQGFNIQMLLYLKMMSEKYALKPAAVLYFNTKKRILAAKESILAGLNTEQFLAQYKLGGYVIDDDQTIIKALDPTFTSKSNIINVTYVKKDDTYKGHILTSDKLDYLFKEIENHIFELYQNMINGNIDIAPKGSDDNTTHAKVNPCRYCDYKNVCHFDIFYHEYELVKNYDVEAKLKGE